MPNGDLPGCAMMCTDVRHVGPVSAHLPGDPDRIRVVMVRAAPSPTRADTPPVSHQDTIAAFRSAGYNVSSLDDINSLGVYVTTAVKCPKIGFGVKQETVEACSHLLEAEIDALPNVRSILLMGNTAIRAINAIAERRFGAPAIPVGSAYKVKGYEYPFGAISLFPSYPESGRNLSVEGNRQDVIAVDIRNAITVAGGPLTRPHITRPKRGQHPTRPQPHAVGGSGDN
ncbi:MAG: uracil-DNA glycosylase family protein [Acidimicrobiia bacterium]